MTTHVEETTLPQDVPAMSSDGDTKIHTGPIARLLAQISRAAEDHAAYKLSKCEWRWISF